MDLNYLNLKENILLRFTLVYIVGILIGNKFPNYTASFLAILLSALLILASLVVRHEYSSRKLRHQTKLVNLFLFIVILLLAYTRSSIHFDNQVSNHYSQIVAGEKSLLKATIIETPIKKEKSIKILLNVNSILTENYAYPSKGKLLCYIKKDSTSKTLSYGQELLINSKIQEIKSPANPNEFNYKSYLAQKNINFSTYADNSQWQLLYTHEGNLLKPVYELRIYFSEIITKYISGVHEQGIASAILLGRKDLLDKEISKIYANTGAMHVLAVSGLHVGIVYLVLSFAFTPFKHKTIQSVKPLILVALIWAYAILTGASPSVLRAATMFTFIAFGNSLKQHISIYNLIAASALLLCLINPFIIMEVGFQLSYLAVVGIIYLQPKIYPLLHFKYYFIDKIWQLTTVSIAAQIATLPISLLYFHQFPVYFWISNLVVIPGAALIVYSGLFLFLIAPFEFLVQLVGKFLSKLIQALNLAIALIDQLPYSLLTNIHISSFQCLLIYLLIITGIVAIQYRLKRMLKLNLVLIIILIVHHQFGLYKLQMEQELTIYSIKKESAIEIRNGRTNFSLFSPKLLENQSSLDYSITPNQTSKHLNKSQNLKQVESSQWFKLGTKSILILNGEDANKYDKIKVDFVILKDWNNQDFGLLAKNIHAPVYIFDSTNPQFHVKDWKKDCEDLHLNCYFVSESGAFIEKWKK